MLGAYGYLDLASGFRHFVERTTAGEAEEVQPVYGVRGQPRRPETKLGHLGGYRGSRPVRLGNRAAKQLQLDVFGELMDVAWAASRLGIEPDREYWSLLASVVDRVARLWESPDRGIWERRGGPANHVHSKVLCWVAVHRAVQLWEKHGRTDAPLDRWRSLAGTIRRVVEDRGTDPEGGFFVRTLGGRQVDSALLLLPRVGFVAWDDERMVRTVREIRRRLEPSFGLLYRHEESEGQEGAFVACSFWLVENLARQGRRDEARRVYDRVMGLANDVGLFSEMLDPATGELLGNFPQCLSHYSQMAAALALAGR